MAGPQSTPNVQQFVGTNVDDGATFGNAPASKISLHGAVPTIQQVAAATPTDLATAITAITQINLILKNKGLTN